MDRNQETDPKDKEGFPEHGAPHEAPTEEQREEAPTEGREKKPDLLADIRRQVDRLERENRDLRRKIEPPPSSPKGDDDEDIDWEKELFANPRAAMKKAMSMATQRAEANIRAERQKDAGQREFWNEFYRRNNDLRDDHDLVEVVLNKNLGELSDLPLDDGYKRLAELTRERIMRYMGNAPRSQKARAEGASSVPGKSAPKGPQEPKISTLSDIIAERRRRRRGIVAA